MSDMPFALGRIEVIDDRDANYPVSTMLAESNGSAPRKPFDKRSWWGDGWWGNQGSTPHCVAYAWQHFLEDGPIIQDGFERESKPYYNTTDFYNVCQRNDQWAGELYDGTSVRAGAKILKDSGVIKAYRWAFTVEEVVETVKFIGPMVVGTRWYSDMFNPDSNGIIEVSGSASGGHAYVVNGVDDVKGLLRIKNSWGRSWGVDGYAYISYSDFAVLLSQGGEACIAFENKMEDVPLLLG
jgi:hypothetical protein